MNSFILTHRRRTMSHDHVTLAEWYNKAVSRSVTLCLQCLQRFCNDRCDVIAHKYTYSTGVLSYCWMHVIVRIILLLMSIHTPHIHNITYTHIHSVHAHMHLPVHTSSYIPRYTYTTHTLTHQTHTPHTRYTSHICTISHALTVSHTTPHTTHTFTLTSYAHVMYHTHIHVHIQKHALHTYHMCTHTNTHQNQV